MEGQILLWDSSEHNGKVFESCFPPVLYVVAPLQQQACHCSILEKYAPEHKVMGLSTS